MLQNWTAEFEQTLRELRLAIIQVNSTRLDLSLTKGLPNWIDLRSLLMETVSYICHQGTGPDYLICKFQTRNDI